MRRLQNSISSVQTRGTVAPAGVTLSEVLVSMLIMSVGVVSLATLFPISVLRTAQATQLTHAVFTRNNAEAAVESNLGLLSNAQIYGFSGLGVIDPLGVFLREHHHAPESLLSAGRRVLSAVRENDGDRIADLADAAVLVDVHDRLGRAAADVLDLRLAAGDRGRLHLSALVWINNGRLSLRKRAFFRGARVS